MPSLADIAPQTAEVTVGGIALTIHAIGVDAVARVLGSSETLRNLLVGRSLNNPMVLLQEAPEAAHRLMAEAMRPEDPKDAFDLNMEMRGAARLPFGDQVTFVETVFRLSFPGGVTPFFERVVALLGPGVAKAAAPAVPPGKDLVTSSPQPLMN